MLILDSILNIIDIIELQITLHCHYCSLQIYQEDSTDVLSGLRAKTHAGRPNWSEVRI